MTQPTIIGDCELWHGDCLEVLRGLPDACVDTCVTDPPYLRKDLWLYEAMAAHLPRVLKRGGSLLAIVPHYAIPEVTVAVGKHLKYRWAPSMWQWDGKHPRMAMGIEVVWKPILWWVNGAWPHGRGFVRDGFINEPTKKGLHEWQQSESWGRFCVKFCPPGGTVLDTFMGSGTTGLACLAENRRFIGIELDAEFFEVARLRIQDAIRSHAPVLPLEAAAGGGE